LTADAPEVALGTQERWNVGYSAVLGGTRPLIHPSPMTGITLSRSVSPQPLVPVAPSYYLGTDHADLWHTIIAQAPSCCRLSRPDVRTSFRRLLLSDPRKTPSIGYSTADRRRWPMSVPILVASAPSAWTPTLNSPGSDSGPQRTQQAST
jgi:hypothetical protein